MLASVEFLRSIGLQVEAGQIEGETFLPGLELRGGVLVYDESKLLYPGDLLHEAGHLAVMSREERAAASANVGVDGGAEMTAIAWSYAAALHLGIDPAVVFHPDGYKGASSSILENFQSGHYFGVPLLIYYGLTTATEYPTMRRWLRD